MTESEEKIRQTLRKFIVEDLLRDSTYDLKDHQKLFSTRMIDSFALAELGVFIQRSFGVYIPDADLTTEQMDTLEAITKRVIEEL
jgi:acyl carrier protein